MSTIYANISSRVKAAFVDAVFIVILMYGTIELLANFEQVPNVVRVVLFVIIFILYEPISVVFFGRTFGHLMNDIVVKKEHDRHKNISFPMALLRFILKATLGWISLLTISSSETKQAIHDRVAKSVVLRG